MLGAAVGPPDLCCEVSLDLKPRPCSVKVSDRTLGLRVSNDDEAPSLFRSTRWRLDGGLQPPVDEFVRERIRLEISNAPLGVYSLEQVEFSGMCFSLVICLPG